MCVCVCLKVLDIVELCVSVLCETENELLPMVHRCWPALLQRLTNDDPLAVPQAFRVRNCVCVCLCGDVIGTCTLISLSLSAGIVCVG